MSGLPREVADGWASFMKYVWAQLPSPDLFIYTGEAFPDTVPAGGAKVYRVEQQYPLPIEAVLRPCYYSPEHLGSWAQQLYGWQRVWELMVEQEQVQGWQYDWVVRIRPDLLWFRPIPRPEQCGEGITMLHPWDDNPVAACPVEFAMGYRRYLQVYLTMYQWIMEHADSPPDLRDPRIRQSKRCVEYGPGYQSGAWHNGDTLLATYLREIQDVPICSPPAGSPDGYSFYHILHLHQRGGIYQAVAPYTEESACTS